MSSAGFSPPAPLLPLSPSPSQADPVVYSVHDVKAIIIGADRCVRVPSCVREKVCVRVGEKQREREKEREAGRKEGREAGRVIIICQQGPLQGRNQLRCFSVGVTVHAGEGGRGRGRGRGRRD